MKAIAALSFLVCIGFIAGANAAYGVDISLFTCNDQSTPANWACLRNNGFSFAIIEAWNGGYGYTNNLPTCVSQAWASGMAHVDLYMFLCPNCGSISPEDAVAHVLSSGVKYGQLWFDIEQCSGCWNDAASNVAFIQRAVNKATSMGASIGFYSSVYEWQQTVGSADNFHQYPLWYAHYDGVPNFSDGWAYQFGGWIRPNIKQYADSAPCMTADMDWYPS